MSNIKNLPLRAAMLFAAIGFTWIFTSDRFLTWVAVRNHFTIDSITYLQNTKGVLFVIVCSAILFLVIGRATKMLERSKREYLNLFRNNPAPMFIYNTDTGQLLAMNEACCKQYGYAYREMKGLHIQKIRLSQRRESEQVIMDYAHGMKDVGLCRHRKKDGSAFWVHKYARRIEFAGACAQVVLAFDVTEQVLAQEELVKQNSKLAELAWFESHKLRAPIARVLGLLNVINVDDPHHPQNAIVLEHLRETGIELDALVRQLSSKTVGAEQYAVTPHIINLSAEKWVNTVLPDNARKA